MNIHGISDHEVVMIAKVIAPYQEKIDCVGLYGSRATGTYRENSDIDLIFYGTLTANDLSALYTDFEESYLSKTVDVQAYHLIKSDGLKKDMDRVMLPFFTREKGSLEVHEFSPDTSSLSR